MFFTELAFLSIFFTGLALSMSRTSETRHIKWRETCKCKCRLDARVCNSRQRWNDDKCSCEYKSLIAKSVCDKRLIWNPSNCECECDKSCGVGEYLNYENCKCRNKLVDKQIEECTENDEQAKIAGMALFEYENESVCSFTICVVLAVIGLIIRIRIGGYFVYNYIYCNKETGAKESFNYQTTFGY